MKMIMLSNKTMLDNFVLSKELMKKAGISPNAFRYWSRAVAAKHEEGRAVFLHKDHVHKKYKDLIQKCSSLDGYIQSQAFCRFTNLAPSHLIESNKANLYDVLDIKVVEDIKFVNLRKFYDDFGLNESQVIYIEKCRYFAPLEKKIKITKGLCVGYY